MLPIYHTHGLFVACNLLSLVGGSMIFLEKFDVHEAIKWIPKVTTMMGVPTFYTRLLENDGLNNETTKNVRLFISGSAPLLAETHEEFEKRTNKKILDTLSAINELGIFDNYFISIFIIFKTPIILKYELSFYHFFSSLMVRNNDLSFGL